MSHQHNDHSGVGISGTLYIVGTPLGNLEDITLRAKRVLGEVDLVAAEDTRRTGRLLAHLEIQKPIVSYYQHNERSRTEELIARLLAGTNIALVTDAGMPGISDPGYVLIKAALERNLPVVPIPGATAAATALVISGQPTERYVFEGFLPRSAKERQSRLQELIREHRTIVLYEAPHRLVRTLTDLLEQLGPRPAAVARELTKLHEECLRGTLAELLQHFQAQAPKGEFVIVIGPPEPQLQEAASLSAGVSAGDSQPDNADVERLLLTAMERGLSRKDAAKQVAAQTGIARRTLYQISLRLCNGNEQQQNE